MLSKRIIPCLDIKDGRTVKGIKFEGLRDAGDPVELGARYSREGADELVFLDITATQEKRKTLKKLVEEIARHLDIPFTIGGGIKSIAGAEALLEAGADKISINSAALKNPDLVDAIATRFGSQFVVLAIDAKRGEQGDWIVHSHGGKKPTERRLFSWAQEVATRGAGEILFTSMNQDGTKKGYANQALSHLHQTLKIPVIASGGAGKQEHFRDAFLEGKADAALAASVFHFNEIEILDLKKYLREEGIPVRL